MQVQPVWLGPAILYFRNSDGYQNCKMNLFYRCLMGITVLLGIGVHTSPHCLAQQDTHSVDTTVAFNQVDRAFRYFRSQPDSAIILLQKAIPVLKSNKKWAYYAAAYNGMYASYYHKGDFNKAEYFAIEAISRIKQSLGNKHSAYIDALNNLGTFYQIKGNIDKAMEVYRIALSLEQETDPSNQIRFSRIYSNMGVSCRKKGDLEEAIRYYQKALQTYQQHYGPRHPRLISVLFSIARVYEDQKNWDETYAYSKKCLSILSELSPKKYFKPTIECYYLLAKIKLKQQNADSTYYFLSHAEPLQQTYGPYRKQIKHEIMGDLHLEKSQFENAITEYRKSLEYRQSDWGSLENNQYTSKSFQKIADVYLKTQQLDSALQYYVYALEQLADKTQQNPETSLPDISSIYFPLEAIPVLSAIASCSEQHFVQNGDRKAWQFAMDACFLADACISRLRRTQQADRARIRLGQNSRRIYETGIRLAYQQYVQYADQQYMDMAFKLAEKSKAMVLLGAIQNTNAVLQAGLTDSIRTTEKQLKVDQNFYRTQIYQLSSKNNPRDSGRLKLLRDNLFEAQEKYRKLILFLENEYPAYFQLKYDQRTISIQEVQNALPHANSSLLQFFWGEAGIYLFHLNKKESVFSHLPLSDSIKTELQHVLQTTRQADYSANSLKLFTRSAHFLYQKLIGQLTKLVPGTHLIVIPDGMLSFLPFEILLTESAHLADAPEQRALPHHYRDLPYLLKKHSFRYGYSSNLLFYELPLKSSPHKSLAAFAPSYPDSLKLAYNQMQATEIANLSGGQAYLDSGASEQVFKEVASQYKILHLSMHGFTNPQESLLAYLKFFESENAMEDSRLHAYELYNMRLTSELVVLAACRSGDGQMIEGEGIMSLARAFRYAGCPSMLTSLWTADGRSTSDLMIEFYKQLFNGKRKARSLRLAKLNFLKSATPDLVHPFFWANHILIGQDRPISLINSRLSWGLGLIVMLLFVYLGWELIRRKKIVGYAGE